MWKGVAGESHYTQKNPEAPTVSALKEVSHFKSPPGRCRGTGGCRSVTVAWRATVGHLGYKQSWNSCASVLCLWLAHDNMQPPIGGCHTESKRDHPNTVVGRHKVGSTQMRRRSDPQKEVRAEASLDFANFFCLLSLLSRYYDADLPEKKRCFEFHTHTHTWPEPPAEPFMSEISRRSWRTEGVGVRKSFLCRRFRPLFFTLLPVALAFPSRPFHSIWTWCVFQSKWGGRGRGGFRHLRFLWHILEIKSVSSENPIAHWIRHPTGQTYACKLKVATPVLFQRHKGALHSHSWDLGVAPFMFHKGTSRIS